MVAAKPPTLAFHAAFFVAALMAGLAVPGLKTVMAAKGDPAFVLLPGAPEQHLLDRAVEVVVAHLVYGHPSEPLKSIHVAFQESLLPLDQKRPVRRARRVRQL